ncbi:sialate O-acetylesterase [Runella sp.]|uniref:sialate O-acetylesterase n=1 Tax=Runella sp. TaxID=1960881 RepID=UPI003D0DB3F5
MKQLLICLLFFGMNAYSQNPDFKGKKLHLYLLVGQSNMAGRGTVEESDRTPNPRIWMLNKENQWVPAISPMHFDKPVAGVGPGLEFARVMAEADTTVIIGLIPAAAGGSPIDSWQPGGYHDQTKSHPYDDAIRRAKVALSSGTLKGILWHQGESDSKPELVGSYTQKLETLIGRFRKELSAPNAPFVVGTLGDFYVANNSDAKNINEQLRTIPKKVKRTACAEATGLTDKGDKTHFDTPSAREFGRRYAEAFKKIK